MRKKHQAIAVLRIRRRYGIAAADALVGGQGRVEVGGRHADSAELGLHPVITHQAGEVGGVWLVAANVGVRVDDRGVGDHPIDALGQAGFAGEHGRLGGDEKVGLRASAPDGRHHGNPPRGCQRRGVEPERWF